VLIGVFKSLSRYEVYGGLWHRRGKDCVVGARDYSHDRFGQGVVDATHVARSS